MSTTVLVTVWDDANARGVPQMVTITSGGGYVTRTAGAPVAVATPLSPNGSGKLIASTAAEASVRTFSGFAVTAAAAPDDAIEVALPGQISTGHVGLTPGSLYYLCGGSLVAATGLAAWIGAQPSDTPYREIGTAQSATELLVFPGNLQTT